MNGIEALKRYKQLNSKFIRTNEEVEEMNYCLTIIEYELKHKHKFYKEKKI